MLWNVKTSLCLHMLHYANMWTYWASGCSECCCVFPVVRLHFSLSSLVCESQLPSLLIRASPLNMSACYNALWVVIFYPNCSWVFGWWGDVAMLSLPGAWSQPVTMTEGETEKKKKKKEWRENVLTGGGKGKRVSVLTSISTQWPAAEHMPRAG